MIDVTFLLLTYFLLTTTFRQAEGQIPGTLPAGPDRAPPRVPVCLRILPVGPNSENALYQLEGVDRPLRSPRQLADELNRIRKARTRERAEAPPLVIRASRGVRWRYVVEAFNQAVRAKFESIRML